MQRSILDFATSNIVLCPICNQDINHLDIRGRTDHVDTCLVRVTFVEIPPKVELPTTTNTPTPPIKKRKVESKYVNGDIDTNKPAKIIKPPTSIKATNKKPIPELKTLTFPPDYKIAVDAFNYAPHDEIDQYFLTHFHADHYGGISKKWAYERVFGLDDSDYENHSKYKKIIYCTGITGRLLTLRYSIDPRFIKHLELDTRYKIKDFTSDDFVDDFGEESNDETPGLYVIPICANHCPGAAIFLFESIDINNQKHTILHCGDFRVNEDILHHPSLRKYSISQGVTSTLLDKVYLDTTYLSSKHNLPKQTLVCETMANLFEDLSKKTSSNSLFATWFGVLTQSRITDFWKSGPKIKKKKFLIVIGTYIIGKEKLALAISKRLNCLIYVSSIGARKDKYDIFKAYQDEYLESVLTDDEYGGGDDHDCVIHLVPMTLVGTVEELSNYFNHNKYYETFERCVGLCPTGWSFNQWKPFRPDFSKTHLEKTIDIMESQTSFSYVDDILKQVPKSIKNQKGKPDRELYRLYSVPYSEHSSFRELAYFVVFFNIGQVIPTVNYENEESAKKMELYIGAWETIRSILTNQPKKEEEVIDNDLVERIKRLSLDIF